MHEIGHDFVHALFHVDHSVLSLFRVLLAHPGKVARHYVTGKRKRYFGPFALLVIVVALASAAIHFSNTKRLVLVATSPDATVAFIQTFLREHANLLFFVQVPLLAAACRALEFRGRFNYAEYLVLAAYASSVRILFFAIAIVPLKYVVADDPTTVIWLYAVYLTLWALYFGLAMAQFAEERRLMPALKGVVAVIAAQLVSSLIVSTLAPLLVRLQ